MSDLAPEVVESLRAQFAIEHAAVEAGESVAAALAKGKAFADGKQAPPPDQLDPLAGKTFEQLAQESKDRHTEEVVQHLADTFGLDAALANELREGKPTTPEIYRAALAWRDRHMRDQAWVARFLAGEAAASRDMFLCCSLIAREPADATT